MCYRRQERTPSEGGYSRIEWRELKVSVNHFEAKRMYRLVVAPPVPILSMTLQATKTIAGRMPEPAQPMPSDAKLICGGLNRVLKRLDDGFAKHVGRWQRCDGLSADSDSQAATTNETTSFGYGPFLAKPSHARIMAQIRSDIHGCGSHHSPEERACALALTVQAYAARWRRRATSTLTISRLRMLAPMPRANAGA